MEMIKKERTSENSFQQSYNLTDIITDTSEKIKSKFWYTRVENIVINDADLTLGAKMLYVVLAKHANKITRQCTLYMKTLAEELRYSIRTVQRKMNELVKKGFVVRNLRKKNYNFNYPSMFELPTPSEVSDGASTPVSGGDGDTRVAQ